MSEWNYTSCAKPFSTLEEAINYMCEKKYDGQILRRADGSFSAVCPTYPQGFYPDAIFIKDLNCSETADCS